MLGSGQGSPDPDHTVPVDPSVDEDLASARRKLAFGRSLLSGIDPPRALSPREAHRVPQSESCESVISPAVMRDTKEPPGHPGLFLEVPARLRPVGDAGGTSASVPCSDQSDASSEMTEESDSDGFGV